MGPEDQVVLVTHQPRWLMDWFWAKAAAPNLRQLVRGHLRGRARVHLAGVGFDKSLLALPMASCWHAELHMLTQSSGSLTVIWSSLKNLFARLHSVTLEQMSFFEILTMICICALILPPDWQTPCC